MAKKRTSRKKVSRSGKADLDSDIRRAKEALSAALGDDILNELSSGGDVPDSKDLLDSQGQAEPLEIEVAAGGQTSLTLFGNPLADLARRHVCQQSNPGGCLDDHCVRVLAGLARTRLEILSHRPATANHPLRG